MLKSPFFRQGKVCLVNGGMWPCLTLRPKSFCGLVSLALLVPSALRPWVWRSAFHSQDQDGKPLPPGSENYASSN